MKSRIIHNNPISFGELRRLYLFDIRVKKGRYSDILTYTEQLKQEELRLKTLNDSSQIMKTELVEDKKKDLLLQNKKNVLKDMSTTHASINYFKRKKVIFYTNQLENQYNKKL